MSVAHTCGAVCPVIRVTQKRDGERERETRWACSYRTHVAAYICTRTRTIRSYICVSTYMYNTPRSVFHSCECVASESVGGEWTGEELARIDNAMDALWSRNCVAPGYQISDSKQVSERKIHAG